MAEDDTYAPATEAPVVIYTASGLSAGPHILTIEVTGTMYPAATASWIVVEAFDVSP